MNYDDDMERYITSGITDTEWDEIDEKDIYTLECAIRNQKTCYNQIEKIILVRKPDKDKPLLPKLIASEYAKKLRKEEELRKQEIEKARNKSEETKQKRELAKLKKLKEKYGEI